MHYCRPISVSIDHDWSKTIPMAQKIAALQDKSSHVHQYGDATHYNLQSLGTISDHNMSPSWIRLASLPVNKTMPWMAGFMEMMKDLGPDDGCLSFMTGPGAGHVDLPHLKSALNYVIMSTDPAAHTWLEKEGSREEYPSTVGTCWLLDTQVPHGIKNSGERWTLSIHFNASYQDAVEWFNQHPAIKLG